MRSRRPISSLPTPHPHKLDDFGLWYKQAEIVCGVVGNPETGLRFLANHRRIHLLSDNLCILLDPKPCPLYPGYENAATSTWRCFLRASSTNFSILYYAVTFLILCEAASNIQCLFDVPTVLLHKEPWPDSRDRL